jgi:hypothetical protein
MSEESAAGQKTEKDIVAARREELATALDRQFQTACVQTEAWVRTHANSAGVLYYNRLDGLVKLMRANAQLASVILRIDAAQNRNSKTQ